MPTTNNNWPTPVATDLVKDGWEAIKDLGDAIDTTLGVYAPSTPGLTLINTTSFSAVASQSVNDVFSTTYDHYKIIIGNVIHATGLQNLSFRLRVAGSDVSTSTYGYQLASFSNTVTSFSRVQPANSAYIGDVANGAKSNVVIDMFAPFLAQRTDYIATNNYQGSSTSVKGVLNWGGNQNETSYTGFTLFPASGNISGSVSVFGVAK